MNKWNTLAGLLCLSGGIMYLFGVISDILHRESILHTITLYEFLGEEKTRWISELPSELVMNGFDKLFNLQIFILLLISGVLVFVLNGIFRKN
ncbi:MAG: hypothetical protein H6681_02205 [Desulfobacteraceae bacterium]|nr:hypothetical protein [Desulfobacteraceae bacterium]MCB9494239.1 hypothetical protein [Desulfobacteraceae bacterium]